MGLVTTLDTMALTDVLRWIDGARKTGILRVTRGKSNVMFHFTDGRLCGATSNDPPLLLGQFLLSRGKISEDALHEALELQEEIHKPLGEILLESGAVTAEDLERACVAKTEETIFGMLEWTEAVVEFDPGTKPGPRMVKMDHSVDDLLAQRAERQDELCRIREVFPDPGMVLCRADHEFPKEGDGSSLAERVYQAVDGKRTLAEIVLHTRTSEYLAMKLLFELYRRGTICVKHVQEVTPESGTPEAACSLARRMIERGDHELALEVLGNAIHAHPQDNELLQLSAETEAAFLDKAYQSDLPRSSVPVGITTREELAQVPGVGATELFLLDSIDEGKWDVKSLVQLSPVHEIDVVRALLRLKSGHHIELRGPANEASVNGVSQDELQEMFRNIDAAAAVEKSIDKILS
jgi:hypothetical protein